MDRKTSGGTKRSRDARVVRTRACLRDALSDLLRDHDLPAVTAQMVVARAGIGYATFFRHYSTVEALLVDAAETMIADFIAAAMPAILSGDRATVLAALTAHVADRRGPMRALLVGGGDTVRRKLVARAVARTGALPLGFDPAIPHDLAVTHAVSATIAVLGWWLMVDGSTPAVEVAAMIDRLALAPLAA